MRAILILLFLLQSLLSFGQSLNDFLISLPNSLLYHLTREQRTMLIQDSIFYDPNNVEDHIIVYKLSRSDESISIEMSYESGQRAFFITQLRFWSYGSEKIFVLSEYGGVPIDYHQSELRTYRLVNGELFEIENLLPGKLSIKDFTIPSTPDSVLQKYSNNSSIVCELLSATNNPTWYLFEDFELYGIDTSWLAGNRIEFMWTSGRFVRQGVVKESYR